MVPASLGIATGWCPYDDGVRTPVALTIAGSDPSGSSGLQADIPTFAAFGVHATSVLTLITAQNSVGIQQFHPLASELVGAQLESLLADMPPRAAKTGLLYSAPVLDVVGAAAAALGALVIDPVMVNSAGRLIVEQQVVERYRSLCARAAVITPNRREAELLVGSSDAFDDTDTVVGAAEALRDLGADTVVVTGGRGTDPRAVDVLISQHGVDVVASERVGDEIIRGTGCTFSAAIVAALARGEPPADAISAARNFVQMQLGAASRVIGSGRPGVPHVFARE